MYGKMVSEGRLVEGCKQTASRETAALPHGNRQGTENEKTGRRQDGMTRGSVPDMAGYQSKTSVNHNFQAGLSIERRTTRLYFNNKR
ncbi:hypothetical protein NXW09_29340 [Bacteroides ovatus]|nr:hypothetical protein [Bacteroides ovatus]